MKRSGRRIGSRTTRVESTRFAGDVTVQDHVVVGTAQWQARSANEASSVCYRRQWRNVQLSIDAQTLEIRAIEVTDNTIGDAHKPTEWLDQIPLNERFNRLSADGADDTKACHEAIARRAGRDPTAQKPRAWQKRSAGTRGQ